MLLPSRFAFASVQKNAQRHWVGVDGGNTATKKPISEPVRPVCRPGNAWQIRFITTSTVSTNCKKLSLEKKSVHQRISNQSNVHRKKKTLLPTSPHRLRQSQTPSNHPRPPHLPAALAALPAQTAAYGDTLRLVPVVILSRIGSPRRFLFWTDHPSE